MRKPILQPHATATAGVVTLSWLKSTPLFSPAHNDEYSRIRIYRKEEPFVFGEDYAEFFLNDTAAEADLVFDGALEETNGRRFTFRDEGVCIGQTLSYWIQTVNSDPVGPVPVRVRDPEVWWSHQHLLTELETLRDTAPDLVRLSACGRTCLGTDIPCIHVGSGPRALGLVGLIHAGESGPELIVPALQRLTREAPTLLQKVSIVAIPAVNIDERERLAQGVPWYLRTNAQGVDLNRNFPAHWADTEYGYGLDSSDPTSGTFRGPHAASAPETVAVLRALRGEPLAAVLSYHALASICGLPALAARAAENCQPYADRCRRVIQVLSTGMHPRLEFTKEPLSFACSAGSLPAWLFAHGGVPAFDLEAGMDAAALAACRGDETDVPLLHACQEQHFQGILMLLKAMAQGRL